MFTEFVAVLKRPALLLAALWCLAPLAAPGQTADGPASNPLLLVRTSSGKAQLLRARSVMTGSIVQIVDANGAARTLDPTAIILQLPWYADPELESGRVNLADLIGRYEATAAKFPEVAAPLRADVQKFTADQTRLKQVAERRASDFQARVAAVLNSHDDPAQPTSREHVAAMIREAESLATLLPAQAADFARAAAPWRQHLAHLDAGDTYYQGEWRNAAALREFQASEASAARAKEFEDNLTLPFDTLILSALRIALALAVPGIVLGALFLWGVILLFRRRLGTGVVLMIGSVGLTVVLALALQQRDVLMSTPLFSSQAARLGTAKVTRLLYLSSPQNTTPLSPQDRETKLDDGDLNAFLLGRTRRKDQDAAPGLRAEQLIARIHPGGVTIHERTTAAGRPLVVSYDVSIDTSYATPQVTGYTVSVGAVPMPAPVKDWLWESFAPQLGRFLADHHVARAYTVAKFAPREALIVSTRSTTLPVAQATPQPSATPEPTAMPAPAPTAAMVAVATPPPVSTPSAFTADEPETDQSQPLPPAFSGPDQKPSPDNTFYIYAIWEGISGADETKVRQQMDALIEQFGPGNRFHRVGFACIMSNSEAQLNMICRVAREKNVAIGFILGSQTHTDPHESARLSADYRAAQWRLDGKSWRGFFNKDNDAGKQEISESSRDQRLPSPSRYCKLVRDDMESAQKRRCQLLKRVITANPGVVTCINGSIEEELAIGAASVSDDGAKLLADYSPFAVAEFRDWLRHTGEYDADHGKYAGEGAPEGIVGTYTESGGKKRSPFYDDPDPGTSRHGGSSFNQKFGTKFTTWALRYWDLKAFPNPITNDDFDPAPESGQGFTDGGFDAPRKPDKSAWWHAWSWDYYDMGQKQPPGNPKDPAFGFRQCETAHWVQDMFTIAIKAGLPKELMFAHQIPGEVVGAARDLSSASPVWSGYLPFNGTVGITRFGPIDTKLMTQYTALNPESRNWGIFEWHPKPNAKPDEPALYDAATRDLRTYYNARCHHLFAGWWHVGERPKKDIFPLRDSQFSKAIKSFLASLPDKPYPGTVMR